MFYQLNQLASFNSGIYVKAQPLANTLYLQVGDFDETGKFKNKAIPMLNEHSLKPAHLLREEDILFAAKGANNFAAVYAASIKKAVASSSFIVIRTNSDFKNALAPGFLAWQLNHPTVLEPLKKSAVGSAMPSITIQQLSTVMIQLPSIEKQKIIVSLHELQQKEKELMNRLANLKETFLQQLLINSINPNPRG